MRYFITGCAGFIGSNLVDRLLKNGHKVIGYDNFSTGCREYIDQALSSPNFTLLEGDLLDQEKLTESLKNQNLDVVFHLAANADIRFGLEHPNKDLQQNTIATFNMLEAMRATGVKRIVFSSTGPIYGETKVIPTPEDAPCPIQTSLYGASKLACEGLIEAYCEGFGLQGYIFRFVSILGERYPHGHVFDFYKQLQEHPNQLTVLGNGKQRKSYLYIQDCLDAIFCALEKAQGKVNIFNLGVDTYCEVNDSVKWICDYLKLSPKISYTGGDRGWVGDNPFIFLDCTRMRKLGWTPKFGIKESIEKTLHFLEKNRWLLGKR